MSGEEKPVDPAVKASEKPAEGSRSTEKEEKLPTAKEICSLSSPKMMTKISLMDLVMFLVGNPHLLCALANRPSDLAQASFHFLPAAGAQDFKFVASCVQEKISVLVSAQFGVSVSILQQ